MKIERQAEKFVPITVTFETYEEAAAVMALCGKVRLNDSPHQIATSEIYNALRNMGICSAAITVHGNLVEFTK